MNILKILFSYCPKCEKQTEFEEITKQKYRCKKCGTDYNYSEK